MVFQRRRATRSNSHTPDSMRSNPTLPRGTRCSCPTTPMFSKKRNRRRSHTRLTRSNMAANGNQLKTSCKTSCSWTTNKQKQHNGIQPYRQLRRGTSRIHCRIDRINYRLTTRTHLPIGDGTLYTGSRS